MITQPDLFAPDPGSFDGDTFDPEEDETRLRGQMARIYHAMRDGRWRTTEVIEAMTGDPAPSIQARIRDLRKEKFGAYEVESRRDPKYRGVWWYRVGEKGAGQPTEKACARCREKDAEIERLTAELQVEE